MPEVRCSGGRLTISWFCELSGDGSAASPSDDCWQEESEESVDCEESEESEEPEESEETEETDETDETEEVEEIEDCDDWESAEEEEGERLRTSSNTKALPESEGTSFALSSLVWRLSITTSCEGNDGPAGEETKHAPPAYTGSGGRDAWSLAW